MAQRKLLVCDLFCGGGGTTTGAMQAINAIGRDVEFVAVNHWPIAIATHEKNHPEVRHFCIDLDSAKPNELVPEGELDLLLASPECRFHSPAQGGRPLDEQNRASAWHVLRWAERLYVRRIVVENVPRFLKWGPLDRRQRPIKSREGELFHAWVASLEALGYRVEWRVLNAADYGTPQTRKRLFIQARRDGRRIVWPEATHARRGKEQTLAGELKTWEPARNVIDFSKRGESIFKKKLSPKTIARIAEGVRRYCKGPVVEPFLVMLRQYAAARSLDDPLPAITTSGNHHVLIQPELRPFVVPQGGGGVARDADDPLPTVATDGAIGLVEPFIVPQDSGSAPKSLEDPLHTIRTTSRGIGFVEPFLVAHFGERPTQAPRTHDINEPLPTVTHRGAGDLVQPVMVEPYLVESNHGGDRVARSVEDPLPTITRKNGVGLIEPMVIEIDGVPYVLDLLHRMLDVDELARGQDFDGYKFTGTREQQTMQIGNAVAVRVARAMVMAAFHDLAKPQTETEAA
jgi:DNA (cytosine-5)-methyltransferase 1